MPDAVCGECPSKADETKDFYCARGASRAAVARRGCLCEECPVEIDHDLEGSYYCIEGAPA